jgi:hypothetical protein
MLNDAGVDKLPALLTASQPCVLSSAAPHNSSDGFRTLRELLLTEELLTFEVRHAGDFRVAPLHVYAARESLHCATAEVPHCPGRTRYAGAASWGSSTAC